MVTDQEKTDLIPVFVKVAAEHIVLVMFILESYEGLGVVRTLSATRGEIVILSVPDAVANCRAVLEDIAKTCLVREIPRPASVAGDWLLSEYGP